MDPVFLELPDKLFLCHKRSKLLITLVVGNIFEQAFDFGLLVFFVEALISLLPDTLRQSKRYFITLYESITLDSHDSL